ncbi:hypothetical protein BKA65DRAFT_414499 [Rhexocercosporidium sp. MPI-PUGE-AT-0058]|nr:hypothetical protein BKA65DRAFT_414499 [Rhexocercosporidium sp. MPI-PUGE-AT-0058]
MGAGYNLKWYQIVLCCIGCSAHHAYFWTINQIHEKFDRLCDSINTTIHKLQITTRSFLQLTHLARQPIFIRFNDFPLEIQRLIWHFASQDPRTIELRRSNRDYLYKNPRIEPHRGI